MPVETRRIDFTEIELRNALSLYQAKIEGGAATEGRVSGIKVMGGEEFSIVAKVSSPHKEDIQRKVFDHKTAIAVMVLFSKKVGIPLPRLGRKVLSPTKFGGVAMTVKYEHHVCARVAPMVSAEKIGQKGSEPMQEAVAS